MKVFFTWILLFTTAITVSAQIDTNATDHLKFKGVPIDGTLREFTVKMKQANYLHIVTEDGIALFEGDFAGYKDCVIAVVTLDNNDLVSTVTVGFPDNETWLSLMSDYLHLKDLLIEKYGEPDEVVSKFAEYPEPSSDFMKFHAVLNDECTYYTTFELSNGSIQLSLEKNEALTAFVRLSYYDKTNYETIRQEALKDL